MEPIGNNPMISELKGKSHGAGGELVDASGQQVVYSTKLKSKTWGLSFADAAKKIALKIESFEKAASDGDHITKQTAQSMIKSWTVKLQELQAEQQNARKDKFTELLQKGASYEELQQNFPDLTEQFMAAQTQQEPPQGSQQGAQQGPTAQEPTNPMEQQFLYGGLTKYAYGSPDPNDPPFYEEQRTDESVPANQASFMSYNGHKIYGADQGIKDYIAEIGMEEFARQWMSNMDPEILGFAGIQEFGDLFENNGDKLKMLQTLYNEKNADQPGFTPIPVDQGIGKFGEHSMSMAGWEELEDAVQDKDSPIITGPSENDGEIEGDMDEVTVTPDMQEKREGDDFTFEEFDVDDIEEEEEEIVIGPDGRPIEGTPEERQRWEDGETNLEKEDVGPVATGDPLQDWGYEIKPETMDDVTVTGQDGSTKLDPVTLDKLPGTDPDLTLSPYKGMKLPPNRQEEKEEEYTPPPYMGDAPYTDIVADEAGVPLQPGPTSEETPPPPYMGDAPYTDIVADEAGVDLEPGPKKKREFDLGEGNEDPFNTGAGDDPFKSKNRWWEKKKENNEELEKEKENVDKELENTNVTLNNKKSTTEDKKKAFNNQRYFSNLSRYLSPMYNLMKSKEGAEVEKKQTNPYEKQILKDMDQRVDIQPWLNQNMMSLKGGMDFSKDFSGGNPMQMFSMYNRLNQGKMLQDSAAWKYKHDAEGKIKTAGANMKYNLGERDRAENVRVSGVNSQNKAALDKHVSTALEQLSAIGQMDEYTSNLMQNDKLRMGFIDAMAPDLEKYMKDNPDASVQDAVTTVLSSKDMETIQTMIDEKIGNVPINVNITPSNENPNVNTGENNNESTNETIDANQVLSGDYTNPLDEASNNVQNVGSSVDAGADETFDNAFSAEANGDLFTPIEGESNKYTYKDQTYVKIKQGDTELFITEEEAITKGLLTEDDFSDGEDTEDIITTEEDLITAENEDVIEESDYVPVIDIDQQATLVPLSIQSTGSGTANILENGQPIEMEIEGGTQRVTGITADGDKIIINGEQDLPLLGSVPGTKPFGEFVPSDEYPSGFKFVPNEEQWSSFEQNANPEQQLMFSNFIQAVQGDPRYAKALRDQISGGEGTLTGTQLNDLIKNKAE